MKEQKEFIKKFMSLYGNPTLQEISNRTGIQITRVFRILNFSPMKYCEYLKFKKLMDEKTDTDHTLHSLFEKSITELSKGTVDEIKTFIKRKLVMNELIKKENDRGAMYA